MNLQSLQSSSSCRMACIVAKSRATTQCSSLLRCIRSMSNVPENTVYSGPISQNSNQRVTLAQLRQKHKKSEPISMVTAYDYPSAVHVDMAGIDICLVGDSAAMVVHGYDTTLPITIDEMLVHCRAVARGAKTPLLVGDLPFGTYECSPNQVICYNLFKKFHLFQYWWNLSLLELKCVFCSKQVMCVLFLGIDMCK